MHNIPPRLLPPDRTPPIRSADDLHRHWRSLMGELGFGSRSLWFAFFTAQGRPTPLLPRIDDLPIHPTSTMVRNLVHVCNEVLTTEVGADGSAAFLLSRPGSAALTPADRSWGRKLGCEAVRTGLQLHPFAVASDEAVVLLGDDEEAAAA